MFEDLNSLFRNEQIEHKPNMWMLHRFLSSELMYAYVARKYTQWIRDDRMQYEVFRAVVPKMNKAPFLKYIAAKRPPAAPELVDRTMSLYGYNRGEAEEALEIIELAGETENYANYVGVEL